MPDPDTTLMADLPEDVDIHGADFLAHRRDRLDALRRDCPVAWSGKHGGFWLLTRYDDVRTAAIDWRTYTSAVVGVTAIPIITPRTEAMLPIEIDPPRHTRYRQLVNPVFAPKRVEEIAPRIRTFAQERLGIIAAQGRGELVADLCIPVAITTLAAFTDVPLADSEEWVGWITRMFDLSDRDAGARASRDLTAYIRNLIAQRRSAPTGDFISMLMAAEIEGEHLTDEQIHSFMTVIFGAGFETTSDGLSNMLHWLATHPADYDRLAAAPAMIPSAIEEFLRHDAPVQIFGRNTTRDVDLHGRRMGEGDIVALAFAAANHDPAVFDCPHEMRLDRHPNRHLTFGAGPHLCAGAGVARMEMAAVLHALLTGGHRPALDPADIPVLKTRGDRLGFARLPAILRPTSESP